MVNTDLLWERKHFKIPKFEKRPFLILPVPVPVPLRHFCAVP
jgi:hypothetical protein